MFSLIYAWINDWVNNREAGDLRRQHDHYDIIVMCREFSIAGTYELEQNQTSASGEKACRHTDYEEENVDNGAIRNNQHELMSTLNLQSFCTFLRFTHISSEIVGSFRWLERG